ncbi:CPBP family intramembrane glutamic endopeptidase [Flavivirga spongiicola]|uniref:CPBP family intramembrane metalloprotease n=1 Tax=Flavivirga spongiicola TaxID=421621 RepID=A0ABU7XVF5_9FLAO|nr:CPBP family intramembrane glutamic endopeptidase [Flavivirga sp. MEBiC05379]MDO5979747.1 CPBP family intramembrane metalloprotease [Flavivirga sp. MEBiC05379]
MKHNLTKDLIEFSETKLKRPISNKRRLIEILGVVLTALGKFIFMDYLDWRLFYVVFATTLWILYIIFRYKVEKGVIRYWGFRTDNFKYALKLMVPFATISVMLFLGIGHYQNTINITWHILPLLITYPIWGSMQQFLIIGLIAGNLNDLKNRKLSKGFIIFITALLFSVVHFPSIWLMIGTFALALFYGYMYLKVKNIYVMGVFHGWLGALFYYTVVNKDPFQEVFLKFLN